MEKNTSIPTLNIMIAAGGTGGHLFPAQALALDLIQKHPDIRTIFVGAGLKSNVYFKKELFSFVEIQSGTPFKKNPIHAIQGVFLIFKGFFRCFRLLKKNRPNLVVGFGSFHTFPVLLAAKLRRVPIVIFESNALPGRVNRFCSKWAKVSAIQFSHAADYLSSKSICVQMPLLKKKGAVSKKDARAYFDLDKEVFTFLVFGGSQGAQAINRFFCEAIEYLKEEGSDFQVIHIVGDDKRAEKLNDYYQGKQIRAKVKAFEEKMDYAWVAADLSISRSGAATLAELIEFTVPGILVPYPYGTENHQLKNAAFISEKVGGAITLEEKELGGRVLSEMILDLIKDSHQKLKEMQQALWTFKQEETKEDLSSIVLKNL